MATAVLVAAGRGERLGGTIPKQYLPLRGQPLAAWSLAILTAHPAIHQVLMVVQPEHASLWQPLISRFPTVKPVMGGVTRQDSVASALAEVTEERILIHDAARPLLTASMVDGCLAALTQHQGVIIGVPVVDTLKRARNGFIDETVDRQSLFAAQTPQAFRTAALRQCHAAATDRMTDDAALLEAAGIPVALITSDTPNPKVTYAGDLENVERLLPPLRPQTGTGFDVHAFTAGEQVMLCGVVIPHTQSLAAHSDGDVALHALTDALLGALGAGDIGDHFPPTDSRWRGADSRLFVREALRLLANAGGVLYNVDITIICERPKLMAHKPAMRQSLQDILGIQAVNVKATTTERLGFTGRGEGIAAQAGVMIGLPG